MGCDVCIGSDCDDGVVQMLSENHPKARKPHECYECHKVIEPGQRYQRFVGEWEGAFQRYDTCLLCEEIRTVFSCGEGWTWGQLWEDMYEIAFPLLTTATECFQELSPPAKACVIARWQHWKGLTRPRSRKLQVPSRGVVSAQQKEVEGKAGPVDRG